MGRIIPRLLASLLLLISLPARATALGVGGVIERFSQESCPIEEMPSRCDKNFVVVLAIRGFWTDAMSCLCDLIKSSPDDKSLRRMRDTLMRQLDLRFSPN